MKATIFYYSWTGNTKKAGESIKEFCQNVFEDVSLQRILVVNEEKLFLKQALGAFFKKEKDIGPLDIDLQGWDVLILGFPVWAFTLPPGMRSFLKSVGSLRGKKVIAFVTYGSGLGVKKCLGETTEMLKRKDAEVIKTLAFSQRVVSYKDRILKDFQNVVEEILSKV